MREGVILTLKPASSVGAVVEHRIERRARSMERVVPIVRLLSHEFDSHLFISRVHVVHERVGP